MAGNNALELAEKRARREASKAAATTAITAATAAVSSPNASMSEGEDAGNDDEVKMTEALGKVKNLTDENIRLEENNTKLTKETTQLKAALAAKKTEAIQVVLEKQKIVEEVEAAKEDWKQKADWYEKEICRVEDLWDESSECFFHTAIDQIRYLNPGVELRMKGMSTLCVVRDDKWYHGVRKYFVEEKPRDKEITPPPIQPVPLQANVAREEQKGPIEAEMVDLGLDANKLLRDGMSAYICNYFWIFVSDLTLSHLVLRQVIVIYDGHICYPVVSLFILPFTVCADIGIPDIASVGIPSVPASELIVMRGHKSDGSLL
ncbi:PAS domain S-box protein [Sesbania bispinosa]|nr:PAS domain S-box protein [Sesbania bispinosa]